MFPSTDEMNIFIATLAKNDVNATEIHRLLSNTWGEETVIKLRRIQLLARVHMWMNEINAHGGQVLEDLVKREQVTTWKQ